jgi:hypothetical protein
LASCSLAAPTAEGNYIVGFFSNDTYSVLASAPLTVSGGGGGSGGPTVVQSTKVDQINSSASGGGPQQCVWTVPAIGTGDTVVGYVHSANQADNAEEYPQSVTDNAGNTYTLSAPQRWDPWNEDIGIWYLTNVSGNPTTFYFTFPSGAPAANICNAGFVEYSGVNSVQVAGPTQVNGANPAMTISPASSSLIWAFAAVFGQPNTPPLYGFLTPGYSILIDNVSNDSIAVYGSNSPVSPGPVTLTYTNLDGAPSHTCQAAGGTFNGCPSVLMAAAVH